MKSILVNYEYDPTWIQDFTDDYLIYDRSETPQEWKSKIPTDKLIETDNLGNADFDRLCYLIDNYENLPEVFLWTKSNLFKYITPEEFEIVKNSTEFTPLLTQNHKTYSDSRGVVCYYKDGMYYERNDSWYLNEVPSFSFRNYSEFAQEFAIPCPAYIPFAPGGNYILTRERVHRYGKNFYERLANMLPYCQLPGEAHFCERSYYTLWS